jgi:hypothetical protein
MTSTIDESDIICKNQAETEVENQVENLVLDNNSFAVVRKITDTKVQIGLVTQYSDKNI